jgi:branched-chain amino acid transport system permease protein
VQPYYTGEALTQLGQTKVAGIPYTNYQLFIVIPAAVVVFILLRWALRRTVIGRLTVAVSEDAEISASMGIDVRKVYLISFAVGSGLAVLAGALESPTIGVAVGIGADTVILSFAVIAIAGLGQIEGTALAALGVGIAQAAAVFLYEEMSSVVPYLIMLLVLIIRPYGIFGSAQRRKI